MSETEKYIFYEKINNNHNIILYDKYVIFHALSNGICFIFIRALYREIEALFGSQGGLGGGAGQKRSVRK